MDTDAAVPQAAVEFLRKLGEKPAKEFDSFAVAVSRFRVLPSESLMTTGRLHYIASFAFKEHADGKWVSKLDRNTLFREPVDGLPLLGQIPCPTLVVCEEYTAPL